MIKRFLFGLIALIGAVVVVSCATVQPPTPVVHSPPEPAAVSVPAPAAPVAVGHARLPEFAPPPYGPDILVVGDSQISFGAGAQHMAFFGDLSGQCGPDDDQARALDNFGARTVAALGVRSTALHSWTASEGASKGLVCDPDKKFGVNAGVYGVDGQAGRRYVQIGEGAPYQFCRPGQSAFQAMFRDGYYRPKLLVLAFLGNATERWGNTQSVAGDVAAMMAQIPNGQACIIMTTSPVFEAATNTARQQAQANLERAVTADGRCSFVRGLTAATLAQATGNPAFFKTDETGKVSDPLHPNAAAQERFFASIRPQLCRAVLEQIGPR
ncbi:SGNH/GDSL hydrolase family protein [Roseovarius sp. 2305UL8-3]|uniref:SGNH/GDSL hydrolase family protein n=1 Tax=Roseovarius conchicola TaxID=3121636 RepID=UPI003527CE23